MALSLLTLGFLVGCQESEVTFFEGEFKPESYALSFQRPALFEFSIPENTAYSFALEITYQPEALEALNGQLPLYYILEGPMFEDGLDKKFSVELKDEAGKWKGEEEDEGKMHQETIEPELKLEQGDYSFKLYADSPVQGTPIPGIAKVVFKVGPRKGLPK